MGLNTDLHTAPYFNDYDENKNYHMMVFKPSYPIQARELTQLQNILQNQIERFGDNILVRGTVVKGGNFFDYKKLPYVKIEDNTINGSPINLANYAGATLRGVNTDVAALVMTSLEGNSNNSPNLNTLYVKYTRSGNDGSGNDIKTFAPGETLEVSVGGVVQPDISVSVAPLSVDTNPVGNGYGVSCGDGVIYQKGYFVRFENQIAIIDRYNTAPDNVVVGFVTDEYIVTVEEDQTLYNNAQGFYNQNAEGADRIKLVPRLIHYTKEEADNDENFLALQEYQEGRLIRKNVKTNFNSITKELEKRTYEESGDYVVSGMSVGIEIPNNNPVGLDVVVRPGVAYVNGKRSQTIGNYTIDLPKSNETMTVENQDILANYGNYVYVDGIIGTFPFEIMSLVYFKNAEQTASSLVGFNALGTTIGNARVLSYDKESDGRYRVYLFDVKMNSGQVFSSAKSIFCDTANHKGFANINLESGKAVLKDTGFKSLVFPLGHSAVKELDTTNTDYVYRKTSAMSVGLTGTMILSSGSDETFPYTAGVSLNTDARKDIIVTNSETGLVYPIVSAVVDANGTVMTIELGALGNSTDVNVTYNIKKNNVKPIGKVIRTVYVRLDCSGGFGADGTFYLGWPDVISIEGIWRGVDNTFTEDTAGVVDVKNNFTLYNNINDMTYGISYIKKKSGYSIANTHRYLVKANVYAKDISGTFSQSFFCVNSYPVDDASAVLPTNRIRTEQIPNGMRDVIDFRPYATNTAAYATTPAAATIGSTSRQLTAENYNNNGFMIAPNRSIETTYSYYLARRDVLVVNDQGEFELISGEYSTNPTYPPQPPKTMAIAKIYIPPFPSLTPAIASKTGYPEYAVRVYKENNRRYTMEDIINLEERLDNIEYYTILNALEKSAEDMVITDSDGLNRFKNGIFVDNFDNMLACEVKSPDFGASVDAGESVLYPRFRAYNLDLGEPTSGGNITFNNDTVASLTYNNVVMEEQRYATKFRNCVTDFYNYAGIGSVYPEYDNGYDETYAPDVTVSVDMSGAFAEFTDALSEIVPLTTKNVSKTSATTNLGSTTTSRSSTSTTGNAITGGTTTTTTTSTTTNRSLVTTTTVTDTSKLVTKKPTTSIQQVGDFITDVSISPYLRANVIRLAYSGLRPNTRFWVWFDGKPVTQYCAMAKLKAGSDKIKDLVRSSNWGAVIRSDANGELLMMFNLPGQKFYVGDREIVILDVDSLDSEEAATSSAVVTYSGFNYSVEKTGLEVSTRTPNYDVSKSKTVLTDKKVLTSTTTSTSTSTSSFSGIRRRTSGENRGDSDPIAQTFFVDPSYTTSDSLAITGVSVAFKKKSPNLGVTLQIRKTSNGYPGEEVLAFGSVRLKSSEVNVSNDGSVFTRFNFKSPITLAAGQSYAIVIIPDGNSPDYQVFCAQTGQADIRTGVKITSDVNAGTLFTSTNNMAWTPYQAENLTFIIYKAQYTNSSGIVHIPLNNYEFLNIDGISGNFRRGETAFVVRTNAAGTITTTNGLSTITGSGTTFTSTFAVGDNIAIYHSANNTYSVARINMINSNTSLVLDEIMTVTGSGKTYFKTVVGTVDYFNNKPPARLILKGSSAKTGNLFTDGVTIRGEITNASALIDEVINLPVSHYQANVMRTNFNNTFVNMSISRRGMQNLTTGVASISTDTVPQVFGDNNRFTTFNTVIKSRSKEIAENSGGRSFRLKFDLGINGKTPHYISPSIDYDISSVTVFEYLINNNTSDVANSENFDGGESLAKYISKKVSLREGFDAEDLKIWLTAYKPNGADINVYVKFISNIDSTPISELPWTKMDMADKTNFRSSSTNLEDYKEFEYSMPTIPKSAGQGAWNENGEFKYISSEGSEFDNFKHFIIKIVFNSNGQHIIPKVRDIRAIALT